MYLNLTVPDYQSQSHPATELFNLYNNNRVPFKCRLNCTYKSIQTLLLKETHHLSNAKASIEQLQAEMMKKIKEAYARVVIWGKSRDNLLVQLKLSKITKISKI